MAALLRRAFDFWRIRAKCWYIPILLLMAGVNLTIFGQTRWMAEPLPATQILMSEAAPMLVAFFVAGLGEELGWSGYITDSLQQASCAEDRSPARPGGRPVAPARTAADASVATAAIVTAWW